MIRNKLVYLVSLIVCTAVLGCASFKVNPTTGLVEYSRFGGQHISGLEVEKNGPKVSVKIQSLDSESIEQASKGLTYILANQAVPDD